MTVNILIKTSRFIEIFDKLSIFLERGLLDMFRGSRVCGFIQHCKERIKFFLSYSVLGRLSEIKGGDRDFILAQSLVILWVVNIYKIWKQRIMQYIITSKSYSLFKEIEYNFKSSPLKTINIIMTSAVLVNVFLSLLIKQKISLFGWIMRGLFLFIGISGLNLNVDWQELKSSSVFLRLILRQNVRNLR